MALVACRFSSSRTPREVAPRQGSLSALAQLFWALSASAFRCGHVPAVTGQALLSLCSCSGFLRVRLVTYPAESSSLCSGSPVTAEPRSSTGVCPPVRPSRPRGSPGEAGRALCSLGRAAFPGGSVGLRNHRAFPAEGTGERSGEGAGRGGRAGSGASREGRTVPGVPAAPRRSQFCPGPTVCADLACLGSKFPHREIRFLTE